MMTRIPGGKVLIAPAELKPTLEKYEIFEELGHGGMASVYRGHDPRLGRDVAVKVIHRHLRQNPEVAARFAREAKAVAKLRHPNIVEVYDVCDEDDVERYLVVQLVRGTTLRRLLVERQYFPAEIAACVAIDIARALHHAHQQGVVHRDVKPENVLIALGKTEGNERSRIKITDFGIAKVLDAQGVTATGQVLGSPAHMAPEQIEGGDVAAPADVFGLGVLLYECAVGQLPFEGTNPAQVLRRVLDGVFTPPERARPTVGNRFGAIISKALSHRPEDRFATAEALAVALEEELKSLGFKNRRGEVARYLEDPEAYEAKYNDFIVERLTTLGREARAEKDAPTAAGYFNRALAFRPDNTELLSEVAGMARRMRLRRMVGRTAAYLVLAGVAAGALVFVVDRLDDRSADDETAGVTRGLAVPAAPKVPDPPTSPKVEVDKSVKPAETRDQRKAPQVRRPQVKPEPAAAVTEVRTVRTVVVGPQNATVRIDGVERQWYEPQQLALGPHTFEFIPPNAECCTPSPPQTVVIEAGEGPQTVRGRIPFKPATLTLQAPPGAKASCGVAGTLVAGQSRKIELAKAQLTVRCHVIPPPGVVEKTKEIDVTLAPGRTFTVAWP